MLDHITFTFIRKMMIEVGLNLSENPNGPILREHLSSYTSRMIEKLVKPGKFK